MKLARNQKTTPAAYGIIGMPLGHSKSPVLHNWGLREAGLTGRYEAWPTEPGKLKAFLAEVRARHIKGVSVTIPHKQTVIPLLDGLTARAQAVGAVNTLFWQDGKLLGDNTDIAGILAPLQSWQQANPDTALASALILGAGGASRAACAALQALGIPDIALSNRTASKAVSVAADFGLRTVPWEERASNSGQPWGLVLNTTPLGTAGSHDGLSPLPESALPGTRLVFDMVYNPIRTPLLTQAQAAGCAILSGLSMFLHQGLEQFRLWTGVSLDPRQAQKLLMADMLCTGK